jgi:hypothetical protein
MLAMIAASGLAVVGCDAAPAPTRATVSPPPNPLRVSPAEMLRALGAHRLEVSTRFRTFAPGAKAAAPDQAAARSDRDLPDQDLEDATVLEVDAKGQFHLVQENNHDGGREIVYVGSALYSRHRYGTFLARDDAATQAMQLREEPWSTLPALAAVFEHSLATTTEGNRVIFGKADKAATITPQASPDKKWRETVQVQSLAGHGVFEGAVPIEVSFRVVFNFVRDSKPGRMEVEYSHRVTRTAPTIRAPEGALPTPRRHSYEDERKRLLPLEP